MFPHEIFPLVLFPNVLFPGPGGGPEPAHVAGGSSGGRPKKRTKGLMSDHASVPFRRYMFDNSSIYRKR